MTRWTDLHREVSSRPRRDNLHSAMIVQVRRMVEARICDPFAPYRIKKIHSRIAVQRGGDAFVGEHPAIELHRLPMLRRARLSFSIVLDRRDHTVEYTVSVVGEEPSGRGWYVRVDLDPEPRGRGPCSHPLLHCHVGVDPEATDAQEVRVPLPWLEPDQALEWILATLHPDRFETEWTA